MLLRNGLRTAGRRLIRRRVIQRASSNKEGLHKSPITEALWKQRMKEKEMWEAQDSIDKNALPPQTTLQSKVPRDSAVRVQYAFTADGELRDRYTNCWGAMDKGIIFEDLDALAGNVAWRHAIMGNGTDVRPPILVTAAVDEVRLRGSLKPDSDIYMTGRVIFVGSSSMLVRCEVGHTSGGTPEGAAVDDSSTRGSCDEEPLLCADFLYVARDAVTGKASKVNRLEVFGNAAADDRDRALFEEKQAAAEAQKRARQMDAASRLALDQAMKSDARALLKQSQALLRMPCLAATRNVSVLVGQTKLQNTMICQPQQRNTSGRIFGGFLMRRAYELAVATAYCFGGTNPLFLWSDEISFNAPVSIGDVLRLDAHVLATEPQQDEDEDGDPDEQRRRARIHIEVFASVLQPAEAQSTLSNRFAFTFCVDGEKAAQIPAVLPSLTGEAIKQIEVLAASKEVPDWDH